MSWYNGCRVIMGCPAIISGGSYLEVQGNCLQPNEKRFLHGYPERGCRNMQGLGYRVGAIATQL